MATFKACVQAKRKDGFYYVYIRVIHHKKVAYIKTDKMVTDRQLTKSKEIIDPYVLQYCSNKIIEYMNALNTHDIENWNVRGVLDFLLKGSADISFSEYALSIMPKCIIPDKKEMPVTMNSLFNIWNVSQEQQMLCFRI